MSTLPPNPHHHHHHHHRDALVRPAPVKMAVSQSAKPKSVAASKQQQQQQQANANANSKAAKSQMHRRSRTGCYTCRLRRKKCDEGTPLCTACKHLGLSCEYKRPMWWSNNEARRQHKDDIKMIIKRKKLSEKASHSIQTSVGSPPGLSHSLPTSATFSDPLDRTRSASIDSQFGFNFNSPPDYSAYTPGMHHHQDFVFGMSPYEIDVKTERQMFVDDVPTIHESHISTFSTYQTPPPPGTVLPSYPGAGGEWTEQVYQERRESLSEEALNCNFFDFAHGPSMVSRDVNVELDDSDQRLLQHFIEYVLPTVFPILESNQHGSFGSDLVLPALQNNEGYLHSCLMVAAQHYKAAMNLQGEKVDADIMRHRQAAIWAFTEGLKKDENHQQILEATLSMIFFQTCVGRYDDTLPDIPWHQHFMAVRNLVERLGLPQPECEQRRPSPASFNMTQTAWIDILGNTMSGSAPAFAHFYRDKFISGSPSLGLRELMGCDDRVMFLVSEIACLEALKKEGMVDDMTLCSHVHTLGEQINLTEVGDCTPKMPFNANGSLSPKQLSKNITAAFRLAARIYLCSLVPGFSTTQASCIGLVEKLTNVLQFIPSGPSGFDRSLAWVYLIGGSVSRADSTFRQFFNDRIAQLGETANMGSFGGVVTLLHEVWQQMDQQQQPTPEAAAAGVVDAPYISWRDVMHMRGWDFLLI